MTTAATATPHLWEVDHPYYATEGNYRCAGNRWSEVHFEYDSWQDFSEDFGVSDPDLNLVYRWDWKIADPDDYEAGEEIPGPRLLVFVVLQRKADHRSYEVAVREEDEPAVRAWLTERARTIAAIWAPILPQPAAEATP